MRIEIEESETDISLYIGGNFIDSMKKPKNYYKLSENKVIQLFGKVK